MAKIHGAAQAAAKSATKTDTQGALPFEQMLAAQRRGFAMMTAMNARLLREVLKMQQHLLDFTARRIERDCAAAEALAGCADAPDVAAVTQEFCAEAISDYAEEASELMRVGAEVATGAAAAAAAATAPKAA